MNHHHIPLATATALVAIARPAMAANGATLVSQFKYAGPTLGFVGIGLMSLEYLSSKFNKELDPEEKLKKIAFSKTFRAGQLLMIGGIAAYFFGIMSELS